MMRSSHKEAHKEASPITCAAVPRSRIPAVWPHVEGYIKDAMGYGRGELDAEDIDAALLDGTMLLLVFCRGGEYLAAVVAELVDKPRHRICHIVAAGGKDADDWLDVWWENIRELAREQDAKQIFVSGRKGWARKLKRFGFEDSYTVIARDV